MTSSDLPETAQNTDLDHFLTDERNRDFATGKSKRLPFRGWSLLAWAFAMACIALFFLNFSVSPFAQELHLRESGILTQAIVMSHTTLTDTDRKGVITYSYLLTYQYHVPDAAGQFKSYTAQKSVDFSIYDQYHDFSSMSVQYLAEDPTISKIRDDMSSHSLLLHTLIFGLVFLGIAFACLSRMGDMWVYNRRLSRMGKLISGRLTSISNVLVGGKNPHIEIRLTYTFTNPESDKTETQDMVFERKTQPAEFVQSGTPVYVLYLGEKHFKLL